MNAEGAITKKGGHDIIRECTAIHVIAKNGTTTGARCCGKIAGEKIFLPEYSMLTNSFFCVFFFPLINRWVSQSAYMMKYNYNTISSNKSEPRYKKTLLHTRIPIPMNNVCCFVFGPGSSKNTRWSGFTYLNYKHICCHAPVQSGMFNCISLLNTLYITKMYFSEMIWRCLR